MTRKLPLSTTCTNSALAIVAVAGGALFSSTAHATPELARQIPTIPASCNTCHTDGAGSARNSFGLDVEVTVGVGSFLDWGRLYNVDSDGDGQSNGMELGDPCGQWVAGPPLRDFALSAPADEEDVSGAPTTGCSDGFAPPQNLDPRPYEVEGLVPEQQQQNNSILNSCGGCTGNTGTTTTTTTTTTALFWWGWRRLRRRRRIRDAKSLRA